MTFSHTEPKRTVFHDLYSLALDFLVVAILPSEANERVRVTYVWVSVVADKKDWANTVHVCEERAAETLTGKYIYGGRGVKASARLWVPIKPG